MAYNRIKFFWGALDIIHTDESPYTAAQVKPMGENATPPGIGVRRALLTFDRSTFTPAEDVATTHFDFQNITGGNPDDTWTDADFLSLENLMLTWWNAVKPYVCSPTTFTGVRWYRIGPGIAPPNPAVKISAFGSGASGSTKLPPQVATSITLKTAVRKAWGRLYLPAGPQSMVGTDGRITSSIINTLGAATNTLLQAASTAEFIPVVYSPTRGKAFSVEKVQVDDLFDVMRSRRYRSPVNRYISP